MNPDDARPDLPPEEQEVARLLAGAGGPERIPEPVAARLNDVLADLVAERRRESAAAEPTGDVVPLTARRRRWPVALLAAAAVVAAGVGIGGALDGDDLGASGGDSLEATTDEGGAAEAPQPEAADDRSRRDAFLLSDLVRLRSDRLEADVLRVLEHPALLLPPGAATTDEPGLGAQDVRGKRLCRPEDLGRRDTWVPATYDGQRATLVTGPERQGFIEATVLSCSGRVLATTTVPAP